MHGAGSRMPSQDDAGSAGLLCLHAGWLRTGFPVGKLQGACVQVFALCIATGALVPSDAKGAVSVLRDKVPRLDFFGSAVSWRFALKSGSAVPSARLWVGLAFACAFGVFARRAVGWGRWLCAELQEVGDICTYSGDFMQGIIEGPTCAVQQGYFMPDLTIFSDQLGSGDCAERGI